ncbi:MAG TPA: carboxypeptidase regulatory-like domain-containing protein [Vicinamibacterales bacterium]|nr:carboxypeptidase regulatory-like domain-containing protein [Vicinamibacterales bacterium]
MKASRARHGRIALYVLTLALLASPAAAQFDRGQISGVIKDSSGAIIPGATVTATQVQTQTPRVTVTDASGFYTFANLPAGRYDISAELQGFKKSVREGVQLDAAGALTIDFALAAGTLSEEVTVTAEQTLLQSDSALRKTVESKDIEQLSFSGRNPIGVAGLKAGVVGGSFNNYSFSDLGNGGFSINGSRGDENNITVDGATAVRTRSSGAIIGIQNVDAIQEVQVLTGDYMPEYGRASGGQIRIVTKSGTNRFSGSASYFFRDDKLQANTWGRNRSTNPIENSGPAPFDYKQYAYSVGGPILKDKLFFFAAQEWVNFFRIQTNVATVPTAKMRTGDFSELLDPSNGFFTGTRTIIDPQTGQPFQGNIIPANRLSANGIAMLNAYPLPTPGFRQGTNNLTISSDNPQDQRKDNIRFDYRLDGKNQVSYRYGKYNWTAIDAFRGTFPYARTDWDRPNITQTASWTSSVTSKLFNEFSFTHSLDEVFINVWRGTDLFQRSKYGINYPYIFPENKEIPDKIPTITIANFTEIDGGPYPSSSRGPIYTFNNATTYLVGRHTFKAGVIVEYSGQDDFDQINVQPIAGSTNNQNGRFQFLNDAAGVNSTGTGVANAALGLFNSYAEIGQRALTKYRSLSTDLFFQDAWRPTSDLTIEGGVRWSYWPPWYSLTNNMATFDPAAYNVNNQAVISPTTGRVVSGPRYNGIVLPGDGFKGDGNDLAVASDPAVLALFVGAPRGFAETHANVFEPRVGAAYSLNEKTIVKLSTGVFHNRVTVSDSMFLGGNPPFQPQVGVSNGSADNPGGVGGAGSLPFGMTAIDRAFKHPTAYMWSAGVQRQIPLNFIVDVTYVGRRGLYLQRERDINQLLPGTIQANPGVNVAALRPYKGYGVIRLAENAGNSKYHSLQISAERRYANGFKFGAAYTLGKSQDNASGKRDVLFNNYDDTGYWGNSGFDRRHVFNFYYIYDLPFYRDQAGLVGKVLGGWQISGATFMRSGTPLWVTESADLAGTGDSFATPWNQNGDPKANANEQFSAGATADQNYWFDPTVYSKPTAGTFGNSPRNNIYNPGQYQWDLALFKNVNVGGSRTAQFRAEFFNFINHANWNGADSNPNSATFGRITGKDNSVRDIQLSVRFMF